MNADNATKIVERRQKDRRQAQQSILPETADNAVCRLTDLSRGGGCGCKIDPTALHEILANVPKKSQFENLLVGIEHSDDAAVYKVSDDMALVFTNDFFTAMVDDPYIYGRIAAANALSDIYAMGGEPLLANAIVGFPVNKLSMTTMQDIMQGGIDICTEAGIPLSGGHSIDNPQPIFGLAAIGKIHPKKIKTNSGAKVGDILILTKPLGLGIMATAFKLKMISDKAYEAYINNITMLNKPGAWLGQQDGVHALTDVTGFGLAGHLIEMANGARASFEVNMQAVPVIDGTREYAAEGMVPTGAYRNLNSFTNSISFTAGCHIDEQLIYADPQTNGGLLAAVDPLDIQHVITAMIAQGYPEVCVIGEVVERRQDNIAVSFI